MSSRPFRTTLLGLSVCLATQTAARAADFVDTRGYWAGQYITTLSARQVIGGFPDGSFRPNAPITRAQFAAIAVRALSLDGGGSGQSFSDVPSDYWASQAISAVSGAGLVTGYPDGSFRPEARITRAQALVVLAKALRNSGADGAALDRYRDGRSVPSWARDSVSRAAGAGIIVNYPDPAVIEPNANATRGEVAALMYQTLAKLGQQNLPPLSIGKLGSTAGNQGEGYAGGSYGQDLAIEKIEILPASSKAFGPGDELTLRVSGTPDAQARFTIQGIAQNVPLEQTQPGVYEGTYTIRRDDRQTNARIAVTLSRSGRSPATQEANRRLLIGTAAVAAPALANGTLIHSSGAAYYIVENGRRRAVPNPQTLTSLGYTFSQARKITDDQMNALPLGSPLPAVIASGFANGTLLKGTGPAIFVIESGQRRYVPDPQTFTARRFNISQMKTLPDTQLNAIPLGPPIPSVVQR